MAKYRSKPKIIEAVQWNGLNYLEIQQFLGIKYRGFGFHYIEFSTKVKTMSHAPRGSWIIKNEHGQYDWMYNTDFEATYELVDNG